MSGPSTSFEFWFSIGSTYSYLTIRRLEERLEEAGLAVTWHPFNVRAIMIEMENIPFATKPKKAAYMWRDIERRAAAYGLGFAGRLPYPIENLERANRVALLGAEAGWCPAFVRAAYRRWFEELVDPSSEAGLTAALSEAGQDSAAVLTAADRQETAARLEAATDAARRRGIFGAPSFVVDGELFWGDDRLEDAIAWRETGRLRPLSGTARLA